MILLQVYKLLEQRIESYKINPTQAQAEDTVLSSVPTPLSI